MIHLVWRSHSRNGNVGMGEKTNSSDKLFCSAKGILPIPIYSTNSNRDKLYSFDSLSNQAIAVSVRDKFTLFLSYLTLDARASFVQAISKSYYFIINRCRIWQRGWR